MLKILLNGCNGKMGQVLADEIKAQENMEAVAGVDRHPDKITNTFPVYEDIFKCKEKVDIIIDFSNPYYLTGLLDYALEKNIGVVIATTGFTNQDLENIKTASKKIPVFFSANMSLGINVLNSLVKKATKVLHESFDIEIIEKHHKHKLDSPSGTAYMIAKEINEELNNSKEYVFGRYGTKEKRRDEEIGIHSIRGGSIVGEHSVIYAGDDEVLEVKHIASSKKIFAAGSIKAAKFLYKKEPGFYNMDDLINLN
ncbi:MAG: 4-hydroxy-tetrahydrodipicolinate reductase [Firmicutes bacterium]|nr:4-hydroxy-tetrahydrodipicolinate reductase [Bacillota bacterium]